MTRIDVVGGVYGERCAFPQWDHIYGSAGRGAVGLTSLVDDVRLSTMMPPSDAANVIPTFEAFGVNVINHPSKQLIGFDYLHCLAEPLITPRRRNIVPQPPFTVTADTVLQFGMMECAPVVDCDTCIYDPQSPTQPMGFRQSGSRAKRLAIVANSGEIRLLTGEEPDAGAQSLIVSEQADIVVVKRGLRGAAVYSANGKVAEIPAYKTVNVFTIGSGDIFASAFAFAWGVDGQRPEQAAEYASQAVAQYVESSALPLATPSEVAANQRDPIQLKGGNIYLAGPFRELGQRVLINEARIRLLELGMTVFSPVHDIGHGPAGRVVALDLAALDACDAVLAILNGSSPGTLFEVGYAKAKGKPVFCVGQNMRSSDMKLPIGSGCVVHDDFVSALHLLAWRA